MGAAGDQSARLAPTPTGTSKLRYPLRSAARFKDAKPAVAELSSAATRGRSSTAVTKSSSVIDLSGKEKSARRSQRLSIPTKSTAGFNPAPAGSITPISETRAKRSLPYVSKSICRRTFNALSSVSYWLTQIKLSESASKHSISLGFFKLALESGCEPLDRAREELKSYIQRHNILSEQEESVKELFQRYNIVEDFEKLNMSESCPKLPEVVTQKSNKERRIFSSREKTENVKPKSLNSDNLATVAYSNKKNSIQKKQPTYANRSLCNNNTASKDSNSTNAQKKSQKPQARRVNGKEKIKSSLNNYPIESGDKVESLPMEEASYENKENVVVHTIDEIIVAEEMQAN